MVMSPGPVEPDKATWECTIESAVEGQRSAGSICLKPQGLFLEVTSPAQSWPQSADSLCNHSTSWLMSAGKESKWKTDKYSKMEMDVAKIDADGKLSLAETLVQIQLFVNPP